MCGYTRCCTKELKQSANNVIALLMAMYAHHIETKRDVLATMDHEGWLATFDECGRWRHWSGFWESLKGDYWANSTESWHSTLLDENDILNDFAASDWLIEQITQTKQRDAVDAVHDAQVLLTVLEIRMAEALYRHHA